MPSLHPCTSQGMGHLGWGSSTALDVAQPGQQLLCLGVPLQGPWDLILAAVGRVEGAFFGKGLMDVTSLCKLFQFGEKIHGLNVFPFPCCLSLLR